MPKEARKFQGSFKGVSRMFESNGKTLKNDESLRGEVVGLNTVSTEVVDDSLESKEPTPDTSFSCQAAPTSENIEKQKQNEAEGSKDDISGRMCSRVYDASRVYEECDMNKKSMRCINHDCDLKSMNVTTKKWQYNERQKKFMYVSRKTKKYVCTFVSGCRVQPMVESVEGVKRTMPIKGKQVGISEVNVADYDVKNGAKIK